MSDKNILSQAVPAVRHPDYKHEIAALLRGNLAPRQLQKQLEDYHEHDIAEALELLRRDERCRLYALLDAPTLAGVLEYTEEDLPVYLEELGIRKKLEVLPMLEPSAAVDYLKGLDKAQRSALIDLMADDVKQELTLLSSFDEDEIGSRMTTNYVAIRSDLTVRQAMKELVRQAADNDNISTLYAVDDAGVLVGAIDLKELIIARENMALEDILMTSYPYVYADELVEDCIERIRGYSEDSIPVLDAENRLCGALTAQDVAELVADELGDDYAKLGGLTAEEDLQEPLVRSISKRLPWLVVLLGLGLVVSSVVGLFERVVTHLAVVICFQSLVLDMAGNVGTQSLAVTIRVLMDEKLTWREELALLGMPEDSQTTFYKGVGCPECHHTGYIGRRAAFEILMVNREVRRLVNDDAAYDELLAAAKKNGYRTMRDSCRDLVLRGITTAEEAARTINSTLDE